MNEIFGMEIMEEEVYRELFILLGILPEVCQQVFVSRLKGKNNRMIAEELGVTEVFVRGQLRFGKEFLHKRLSGLMPLALLHHLTYPG